MTDNDSIDLTSVLRLSKKNMHRDFRVEVPNFDGLMDMDMDMFVDWLDSIKRLLAISVSLVTTKLQGYMVEWTTQMQRG